MLPVRAADDVKARLREGRSLTIAIGNPYRFSRPTAATLRFTGSAIVTNQNQGCDISYGDAPKELHFRAQDLYKTLAVSSPNLRLKTESQEELGLKIHRLILHMNLISFLEPSNRSRLWIPSP